MSISERLLGSIKRLLGATDTHEPEGRSPTRRKYDGPRVITFVDGANLDVALRKLDDKSLRWCDLKKLSIELIDRADFLREVRFYAAPPKYLPPDVMEHYKKYVNALRNKNVVVIEGNYKSRERKVTIGNQVSVGRQADTGEFTEDVELTQKLRDTNSSESDSNLMFRYTSHEEKETDVNIALDMLDFAHKGKYDKCILISGDTDFNPVVDRVLELAPHLSVLVVTPPDQRRNIRDSQQVHRQGRRRRMEISRTMLERSMLPSSARNSRGGGGGGRGGGSRGGSGGGGRSGGGQRTRQQDQQGGGGGGGGQRRRGGGGGGSNSGRGGGGGGGRQRIGSTGGGSSSDKPKG